MSDSKIEWTDKTWNPVRGCSLVSEGCRRCYAMKQAHRFSGPGAAYEGLTELGPDGPRWTGTVRVVPELLHQPLRWKKPQRVFVNSMSDLFHHDVPMGFVMQVFAVMLLTPKHTYQILTKRPERMREMLTSRGVADWVRHSARAIGREIEATWSRAQLLTAYAKSSAEWDRVYSEWPLRNVQLGVSVEDQKTADERIPLLLQTPAAERFVSYEPALGPVDFTAKCPPFYAPHLRRDSIGWIIIGGESGPNARPFNLQWARDVIAQCKAAGVAAFFKQAGANPFLEFKRSVRQETGNLKIRIEQLEIDELIQYDDPKGGDMSEWPEDLRVREFPV